MTWSYNASRTTNLDEVRFLVSDTDTNDQLLQDEEITASLANYSNNVYGAAKECAESIATKLGRRATSWSNLSLDISWADRAKIYSNLALELEQKYASSLGPASVFAGGLTISGKETLDSNTDLVQPPHGYGRGGWPRPRRGGW